MASSFIILGHPYPIPGETKPADSPYNMERIIYMVRAMRAYIIFSKILMTIIDSNENKLFIKFMRGIEIFWYMGVILYQQYFVIKHLPKEEDDWFVFRAKLYMVIEVIVFYSLIISSMLFLLYI